MITFTMKHFFTYKGLPYINIFFDISCKSNMHLATFFKSLMLYTSSIGSALFEFRWQCLKCAFIN